MEVERSGTRDDVFTAVSYAPQSDLRGATGMDRWAGFLQLYESFITRELAQEHPQFARALRQLERDTRLEQERQSAQVLATLRIRDATISELQKVASEQREQLDVVLDELERRETKEEKDVQVGEERQIEDAAVQTESVEKEIKEVSTQTMKIEEESGVLALLEKLEKELKTLEEKNLALERELQQRVKKNEKETVEGRDEMKNCLEILQRGVEGMNLSCGCVESPLTFFVGVPDEGVTMSTCVNLEHCLEAQAVRLEHVQKCLYLWRDAAVQFMKRQGSSDRAELTIPSISPSISARQDEERDSETHCLTALRGVLAQIRQHIFESQYDADQQHVVTELAKVLADGKSGAKVAAKMVRKWAGWEGKHLDEIRSLRQGFAEQRAVDLNRRIALVKRINQLERRELDLKAEVNALRKKLRAHDKKTEQISSFLPFWKPDNSLFGADKCESLEYPQLAVRLATAEQNLFVKDEQLAAANETIRALSAGSANSGTSDDSMNRLVVELQRASKQKFDFFRRREKDLVTVGQYFQMEKVCLQLQSRLDVEKKQAAIVKAAKEVCDQERDELLMKVEKLEMEALLANINRKSAISLLPIDKQIDNTIERYNDDSSALLFALKRLRLIEDDRNVMRERLRHYQQQVALHREDFGQTKILKEPTIQTNALNCVAEHHQNCVRAFKEFLDQQSRQQEPAGDYDTVKQSRVERDVFLSHYDALWIAFNFLYSFLDHLPRLTKIGSGNTENGPLLCALGEDACPSVENYSRQETLEFEVLKRDEKIMLLQQQLMDQREQLKDSQDELVSHNKPVELVYEHSRKTSPNSKDMSHVEDPFLASTKPLESDRMSGNGSGNEATLPDNTALMEDRKRMAIELEECLAKCAYLTSQNSKLVGRLKAEKETNKKHLKEQEELRSKLSARPETNSELKHTFEEYRDQVTASSSIRPSASEDTVQSKGTGNEDAVTSVKNSSPRSKQENESLREQLALREHENLALVQSLCTIKEKCAQTEAFHQKEFRVKTAEHAESMESYMSTVNETLSRIESDKRRLEEENTKLRSSLQQLEEDRARNTLEKSQRSTTGTNTESTFDLAAYTREKETLTTRIYDLELQLSRERKLVEVLEQKKHLQNQHEEQLESNAKSEALKAQQEYKTRCEVLQKWREKLQLEFADYQAVHRASQHESDRRIEFLSACIEEFVRVADDTAPTMGKTVSTKELYDVVMELARTRDTIASMKHHAQKKQKAAVSFREDSWSDLLFDANNEQNELEMSEAMWWKLRASKTEAYVRSAMLQNDTFEDTIQQLELRMSNVKQELSSRLSREAQLVSQLAALKSELATTKEQAASLAEKYQHASVELEKRQGEASTRGDETQRARMAVQRKTELLSQQKAKVSSLQQELEQASKKLERLATAEKQTASLQQKAKEHTQQLLQARQSYQRCHEDNVQLSIHLEQMKERHASIVTRLKAARLENANLRAQCVKNSANVGTKEANSSDIHRGNQVEANAVSVASLSEETRALKRRVMQKQDVIVGYKAKVTEYEARLERQRETMVKLARTNRELRQGQRQRQQQEQEYIASVHARLEAQLGTKQEQLDGLRASVYDSFEAFVYCQPPSLAKTASSSSSLPESPIMDEAKGDDGKLFAIKRWTDFSVHDLEELKLTRDPLQPRHDKGAERNQVKRNIGRAALQEMEEALEANPEDCRAEICELLQCLCY
ncbi:hypothetical protein PC129_g8701 [Phytophthora cactorum]|uniref:Uncharacterized protein n=1 Tax=Phytophthora cactorum TaxID=29920 RepID=A0A8T1FXE5_9STRA|nr:hypothetical protein Pcac1_g13897 [Phytophthora cactorum]KAG2818673.1 hypothetical protein PC111_g12222 [Phytophthora cactorum]KAG2823165.1 hypothetical protein PC112_g10636 [Phytophthora cactorum]KAG2854164.1 hypothetical protein PC113_g13556 [Phytophthora cactorum]KAG2911187.1 hypothetical protein PC115_g12632 [Phytophthora cactorum]